MTVLLLKVSGVTLLEKDIGERRPDTRAMCARRMHSCREDGAQGRLRSDSLEAAGPPQL